MPEKSTEPEGWSVLLVPTADVELLLATLAADAKSRAFDRALRLKIERALDNVTEFEVTYTKAMAVQELLVPTISR